ncbi:MULTISPECIES: glycosyltransferase [Marichromatium]|uniref:Dolichol-phosphate mannosyltransferase n=1 Tax=Marichromatium gracile TaxID=1048 RepID=A0A4R4A9F7_MARGR|nr:MULTISPECIES: glycosyltransferase family 2 protein [Marichromatium]MBK1708551.1 dolichol monophosphate mannose synthase [Marichromatium gracile]MBO8084972.1 glycosyltransferase family 2 protein [Marichromatium sp.]RNE94225.1 glycosyltransferase family 2 protein [Marichromatium sp. AB32]TCW35558.1 dolichol-phosphate mannosyltransferase [Marichromatium gracile]
MPHRPPHQPPQLAVVVPTYKEAGSVPELVERVRRVLDGLAWELIFVDDDSPDGTAERVREQARQDPRVRLIRRVGRRGLSSACIEGMLATTAPCVAVMDGDLQHDESLLRQMYDTLDAEPELDLVVGSRYVGGGGVGEWNARRQAMSRFATRVGQRLLGVELADPMSGFFMVRAAAFQGCVHRLSGVGFKILLDIVSSSERPLRCRELPFTFRERHAGTSKLDNAVLWEYLLMLAQKTLGSAIPVRFLAFSLIGGFGVFVHMAVLWPLLAVLGEGAFLAGQATATLVAMTSNFFLNNLLTYRDMRLRGRALLRGWLSFVVVCSVGALANVGIANYLFVEGLSGWFLSALAGILVGAVWNYAVTAVYTWRRPQPA